MVFLGGRGGGWGREVFVCLFFEAADQNQDAVRYRRKLGGPAGFASSVCVVSA